MNSDGIRSPGNRRRSRTVREAIRNEVNLTYTVDEVAMLLGVARGVAYDNVRNGLIPAVRVGRRWLVPRSRFHAWLDATSSVETNRG
jgi:excisionase family DNA binding protein